MIEIVFERSYYQGRHVGAMPEAHLRLRWPDSGARDRQGSDAWAVLRDLVPSRTGEALAESPTGRSDRDAPEQVLHAARRLAEALGEVVEGGSTERRPDGVSADLRLALDDSAVGAQALRLAVIAANGRADVETSQDTASFKAFLADAVMRLSRVAASRRSDVTTTAITRAAGERAIPYVRFDRWPFIGEDEECPEAERGLLQLGEGCRQHRLRGVLSGAVSRATLELLSDHWATWLHLKAAGLPVGARDPDSKHIVTVSRARRAAARLGYPVVVKPRLRSRGVGVIPGIADERALSRAVEAAQAVSRQVVVERQASGEPLRLLVVGGAVAAFRRRSGPATADVHDLPPGLHELALRALTGLDLKIAEVDMLVQGDWSAPLPERVTVLGIDPVPDLGRYRLPGETVPMAMSRRLVAALFPPGTPATIPKVAITGTNGKTTTAHVVAKILQQAGHTVGLASTNGCFVNARPVLLREASYVSGALEILQDKHITVAVLETARGGLARKGLAFHDTTVAACTNIANDHIGLDGIDTLDQMAEHKRQVVETALECAVLNGDDPRCQAMRPYLRARRHCLFSLDADAEAIVRHVAEGGIAATVVERDGQPTLAFRSSEGDTPLLAVRDLPIGWDGHATHNIENALCAAGLAFGLGVEPQVIGSVLRDLQPTTESIPGRLNRIPGLPYEIIADAAHNAHGMHALRKVIERMPRSGGKRIMVLLVRESDTEAMIDAMVAEVADLFDLFVCRDGIQLLRCKPGDCANALAAGFRRAGVEEHRLKVIPDRLKAMGYALDIAEPGDLVVVELVHQTVLNELMREIEVRKRASSGRSAADELTNHGECV